ncbi:MAG TPA: hypothetical protein VFE31_13740, partial [Opitutaceae bacterium]|nr:hypothetical protein [Opitutaceae bacterium]
KAFYFEWLFAGHPDLERLHYLDPDIGVYHALDALDEGLARSAVLLTPHHLTPIPLDGRFPGENLCLNHGLYNLGYLGLRRGAAAARLLGWWRERMREQCVINLREGWFVDQLWFNLVPLYFDEVGLFRHPGANVAFWNLHERRLADSRTVEFGGEHFPLLFFHFSGFSPRAPLEITRVAVRQGAAEQPALRELLPAYAARLQARGWDAAHGRESVYTALHNAHVRSLERRSLWRTLVRGARQSIPEPVKRLLRG